MLGNVKFSAETRGGGMVIVCEKKVSSEGE
jgi:hypothetical protein